VNAVQRWFYDRVAVWCVIFKQPAIAREYWAKLLAANPKDTRILSMIAHQDATEGKDADAIAVYERIFEITPEDKISWFNYGFLVQKRGDHAKALKAFEKVVAADEKIDRAWFGKGLSHVALQQYEPAAEAFKKTNKLQPLSPHGYYELAKVQHALGDDNACEKTMRKVKDFDPKVAAQLEDETGIRIGVERWWAQR
jgi:tetratricopeptide (TPR) repeat protein